MSPRRSRALRVGAHTSISGGLHHALTEGEELGCDVIQIFSKSSRQWASKPLNKGIIAEWQTTRRQCTVEPAMVHASYLINLAAATGALRDRSRRALADEYRRCEILDIPYLVFHPGSHMDTGEKVAIDRIAAALRRVLASQPDNPTTFLLENTAGQGTSIGHRFSHLRDILAQQDQPERIGICLDTCHAFAAGYDLASQSGWDQLRKEIAATVGLTTVKAIHANDSKTPRDSRVDRHEHIGRGTIGLRGFIHLVNDPTLGRLPIVLETPKPTEFADPINLAILRALHDRQRVGSRARRLAEQPLDQPPVC